jgi:hypothetical protein
VPGRSSSSLDVLDIFETLPLPATTAIVAVIAAVLVACLTFTKLYALRWLFAFVVPFAIAYAIYWVPVWNGADSSEYSAWAPLVISIWSLFGIIACSIVVVLMGWRRRSVSSTSNQRLERP